MLFPFVLLAVAIYVYAASFLVRRSEVVVRKRAVIAAWLIGLTLFVGDHALGYIWLKWYTSTISTPVSSTFTVSSLAIENRRQSEEQRKAEKGDGGGGGLPPIFPALNAASHILEPIRHQTAEDVMDAYNLIPSVGYSVIEVIDLNHQQIHPDAPPRVLSYSIFKRPDLRCAAFEKLPPEQLKKIQAGLTKHGLLGAENYCIGKEETNKLTAKYKSETRRAEAGHPRQWSLPPLMGVYPSRSSILDTQSGQVVQESKGAYFYGGWVSQFVRFIPDMDYELSNGDISTKSPVVNRLPYTINTSVPGNSQPQL